MAQTRDKRRRTDLDLFVLALIESGLSSPYDFQKAAKLSPGATIPALQRLLESGFVRQGKPGPRGRTDNRITPAGKKLLKTGWRGLIEDGPSGDLDADLRIALLALFVGGHRRLAKEFLEQSAAKKLSIAEALEEDIECASGSPLADWYTRLRSEPGKAILKAESAAALAMAKALPRKHSAKRPR
jgi:DNA-binding PadR family transcriptional regulator